MFRLRAVTFAVTFTLALTSAPAFATGAWEVESQYQFTPFEGISIVGPFIDGDGLPWVLGNLVNTDPAPNQPSHACLLYGPFDNDSPAPIMWLLPDDTNGDTPLTQCLSVEPGPDGGFLVRGYILVTPLVGGGPQPYVCGDVVCDAFEAPLQPDYCPQDCGPLGFIALLDDAYELVWGPTFDLDHVERGTYLRPLPNIGWSESRDRVLVFFQSEIDIGPDTVPQLHGVSIADGTGLVRRVITAWGDVTDGDLEGLDVKPDDGRFLVVAHANGSEFLLYNGLESIDQYPAGGLAWSGQKVAHVQFGDDETLYIQHHPRLDLGGITASMTRTNTDGTTALYTRSLDRVVTVAVPEVPEPVELTLRRPVLAYATTSTFTFVRQVGSSEFALHVYDNFNGVELAIQPLSTIDDNPPTHVQDARRPDRLILMTQQLNPDLTVTRRVNTLLWNPDAETPGGLGGGEDVGPGDLNLGDAGDAGEGDAGGGGGGSDEGCCRTAVSGGSCDPWLGVLGLAAMAVARRRRPTRVSARRPRSAA